MAKRTKNGAMQRYSRQWRATSASRLRPLAGTAAMPPRRCAWSMARRLALITRVEFAHAIAERLHPGFDLDLTIQHRRDLSANLVQRLCEDRLLVPVGRVLLDALSPDLVVSEIPHDRAALIEPGLALQERQVWRHDAVLGAGCRPLHRAEGEDHELLDLVRVLGVLGGGDVGAAVIGGAWRVCRGAW